MIICKQLLSIIYKAKYPNINIITNFFLKVDFLTPFVEVFVIDLGNVGKVGRLSHFLQIIAKEYN